MLGNVGTHAVSQSLSKNPPYNVAADFAPVGADRRLSLVLVTRKDLPAAHLQEFIAYAKANQDKMQFASASAGSATQLGCALLNAAIGVNVTHIPYRGGGPAMQDLVAGRIDYHLHRHPGRHSVDRGRADQGAGDPHPRAFGEPAECAVGAGAGPRQFRGGQLGGVLHAQGHARADRGEARGGKRRGEQARRPCRSV